MRNISKLLTISSGIGEIEEEIIKIGAENRKAALTGVGFQGGVDDSTHELVLVHNKPNRSSAAEDRDADQEPVALGVLILLLLVVQHRHSLPNFTQNTKKSE